MALVEGMKSLQREIRAFKKLWADSPSITVGYSASYALFVHEMVDIPHDPGQAKFLEQPMREKEKEIGEIARAAMDKGETPAASLLLAGRFLQRESQLLCPVDTGALRGSAFTKRER